LEVLSFAGSGIPVSIFSSKLYEKEVI
jgi:hypothetical protein